MDMEKAYDFINGTKLLELLRHRGVQGNIINLLRNMYDGITMKFTIGI